jgi:hypothetical protein
LNARIIAFVMCRLFAVYLVVAHGINAVLQFLIVMLAPHQEGLEAPVWHYAVLAGVTTVLHMLLAAVLWNGASWISRTVSAPMPEKVEDKPAGDGWQAVVVFAVGWLTVLSGVAYLVNGARALMEQGGLFQYLMLAVIFLGIGGALIMFPGAIVSGLERFRAWGGKPLIEAEDQ